ncbi:phospho-sugar mutase [Amycolatopsis regifaucium]|uniref:Phosphomannomutase n=1 Tax=Amycolatopsis regifaucium TaxID=546365 RepID=A0A154MCG2_9PSEU|nr:phospho-sugar mutase [Amycolatopsis regifaucium]KZB82235.1 phosphomannomutase [Amycolatopsis regifaucium]OKA05695.1 phosphomannomutase [Amycolatopsis regifaucium]SFG87034.1 phosphomannomutase [Amycolatopsis regifaucium]
MTTSLTPALRDRAFRWIADDPDDGSRVELQNILARAMGGEADAADELADRMAGPLEFGTAGLRGPVRAGPNGMNVAVVTRTTAGVAAWLSARGHSGGVVVVGRDARHGSEAFASAAAEVLTAAGFAVKVLPRPLPTPVLAFAVLELGAVAGIQLTASHNPPADNGYKLYDATGGQIVPPSDGQIEQAIEAASPAIGVPRAPGAEVLGDELLDAYLDKVALLPRGTEREIKVAATALHGVGAETLRAAFDRAGFTDLHQVTEQATPDPDFPTVSFPNPEEPGATDLLLALASEVDADLAVALDPDADRCALGVRERDGSWRMLRGDETGVLLGWHILSTVDTEDPLVATTIVSSSMLGEIATDFGARYAETLTGFKWLVRAGERLVFAYEEALGLCVNPHFVRDKDGISAAVFAAGLAASLRAAGRGPLDVLDELAVRHGVHVTDQVSLRVTDLSVREKLMAGLRAAPPAAVAGTDVTMEDLRPGADVLRLTGEGLRVVIRPSGTEPKLKAYLQVKQPVSGDLAEARATAETRLAALRADIEARLA